MKSTLLQNVKICSLALNTINARINFFFHFVVVIEDSFTLATFTALKCVKRITNAKALRPVCRTSKSVLNSANKFWPNLPQWFLYSIGHT